MKAVVYLRVSTIGQETKYGLKMQERACMEYASKIGLKVVQIFQDDISGTVDFEDRPGGKLLLSHVNDGQIAHVIVYSLDRLSRPPEEEDIADLLIVCKTLRKRGVSIHSVGDGGEIKFDTVGQLLLVLQGGKASSERNTIRKRVMDGKREKALGNKWVGSGATPFGYRKVGKREDSQLMIYEPEAIWVREMYRLYSECGLSLRAVAKALDDNNAPRSSRRVLEFWSPTTVRWILRNPIYKGLVVYKSHDPETGEENPIQIQLPDELAIVSQEVWEAAQERIEVNIKLSTRNQHHKYLLSGFFRCGICGAAMRGRYDGRGRRYSCGNRSRPAYYEECPNTHKRINADRTEKIFWDWLNRLLTDEEYLNEGLHLLAAQAEKQLDNKRERLETVQIEISDAENKVRRASAELLQHDDDIVLSALRTELKKMTAYLNSLCTERERLELDLSQSIANEDTQNRVKELARQVQHRLPGGNFRERRELMAMLGTQVIFWNFDGKRILEVSCELPECHDEIEFNVL